MKYSSIIVVFENNLNSEDITRISDMLRMIRGVAGVEPVESDVLTDEIARQRVRHETGQKIMDVLYPPKGQA